MNKFYKAAVVAVAAALASQVAQAVPSANNLYLGLTQSSAQNDYIIDLGLASSIIDTSPVVDLSGDFSQSTFNSTFSGGATGVAMGSVGAATAAQSPSGVPDFFVTQLRGGGPGSNPFVKGTESVATLGHSSTVVATGASSFLGVGAIPPGGSTATAGKPWANNVAASTSGTFFNKTGAQPDSTISSSDVIYEDVFEVTSAGGYVYQGYLTFDDSNTEDPILTFTNGSAVPEPAAYGSLAGLGVLALALRRQFARGNA